MTTRGSEKVAKRRSAAQRVQAKLADQIARLTVAVNDAMVAADEKAAALAAVELADDDLRAAVARLAELGQSHEEIAELVELDVTEVRALRRPKRTAEDEAAEGAVYRTEPGPRRSRAAAGAAVLPPSTSSAGPADEVGPGIPKDGPAAASGSLAAAG